MSGFYTLHAAKAFLIEGGHLSTVLFHFLQQALQLFVNLGGACVRLYHGNSTFGHIVAHFETPYEVAKPLVAHVVVPLTARFAQPLAGTHIQKLEQQSRALVYELGQCGVAIHRRGQAICGTISAWL